MLKAIIFDCFGVLATDELLPFLREHFDGLPGQMAEAIGLIRRVDSGQDSYDDMIQQLADMAVVPFTTAKAQIEHNVPDENLFAYIREELKPKYKLGLLSNSSKDWLGEIFQPDDVALFDATILSYQVGYAKPDIRIYQAMAEKLATAPEDCLMVDDQERYCIGAQQAGMRVVAYKNLADLKQAVAHLTA